MKRKWIGMLLVLCMIVSILPTGVFAANSSNYKDVNQKNWYIPYVNYVLEEGLMTGISSNTFAPNGVVTRAQYVQVLFALSGKPTGAERSAFTDLKPNAWYVDAVNWAASAGVTGGITATTFGPERPVTREQAATFFRAYMEKIAEDDVSESGELNDYPDASTVSKFAIASMKWATGVELVSGVKKNNQVYLSPKESMTRAQLATMLMRFDEMISVIGSIGFNFRGENNDVLLGQANTIRFYADVESDESQELLIVDEDGKKWLTMNDEGIGADKAAGDHVYTASCSYHGSKVDNKPVYLEVNGKRTDEYVLLNCYDKQTSENYMRYDALTKDLDGIRSDGEANGDSLESIKKALRNHLEMEKKSGVVDSYTEYENSIIIHLTSNQTYVFFTVDTGDGLLEQGAGEPSLITLAEKTKKQVATINGIDVSDTAGNIATKLEKSKYGFQYSLYKYSSGVNIEVFKNLKNYGVIILDDHGKYDPQNHTYFMTNVMVSEENDITYAADLNDSGVGKPRVLKVKVPNTNTEYYWVTTEFFNHYYNQGDFKNSLVYLNTCHSADDASMAKTLISKGVATVYGYTHAVTKSWGRETMETVFDQLMKGKTTKTAYEESKDVNGIEDRHIDDYEKGRGQENYDKAVLKMFGNKSLKLSKIGKEATEKKETKALCRKENPSEYSQPGSENTPSPQYGWLKGTVKYGTKPVSGADVKVYGVLEKETEYKLLWQGKTDGNGNFNPTNDWCPNGRWVDLAYVVVSAPGYLVFTSRKFDIGVNYWTVSVEMRK